MHVQVTPISEVRHIITHDLGAPPEQLFKYFDPNPIASASLAQVHVAHDHDGRKLVRVQLCSWFMAAPPCLLQLSWWHQLGAPVLLYWGMGVAGVGSMQLVLWAAHTQPCRQVRIVTACKV